MAEVVGMARRLDVLRCSRAAGPARTSPPSTCAGPWHPPASPAVLAATARCSPSPAGSPAPILAERLGIHQARAAQWVRAAGATYSGYVELRIARDVGDVP